jgi:DNA-binding NtrC family response regulator
VSRARILVVDDKDTMRALLARVLDRHDVATAADATRALALLETEEFDVVLTDIKMPGLDGHGLLAEIRRSRPRVPVILMTAFGTVQDAVAAMKLGALDYLVKPFEPDEAVLAVERAIEWRRLHEQTRQLRELLDRTQGFSQFVGASEPMQRMYTLLDKAAGSGVNVLLMGESGTGKELAARTIHRRSARADAPFVAVNCGALPESLAESELFGHVRGAFTGAISDKAGLFEEAAGGTLFLDEIAALPQALQVKLNRVLEEREARRVGSTRTYSIDVRWIAAANVDLKAEVAAGRFREDLWFRLNVLQIRLPPLRERREDVPLLAAHFLAAASGDVARELAPEALRALLAHRWPGNVRELRNVIERAVAVADDDLVEFADLPPEITADAGDHFPAEHLTGLSYAEACELGKERTARQYLVAVLRHFRGNVTQASERAGVERESLHRLLRRYDIDPQLFRERKSVPGS